MTELWTNLPGVQQGLTKMEAQLMELAESENGKLSDILGHLFQNPGKYLRAGLCLLCGELNPGGKEGLVQGAMALEMLHLATLIHDDIVDNSGFRRGKPSLHKRLSIREALLVGDFLFSKSLLLMAKLLKKDQDLFMAQSIVQICRQEIEQSLNASQDWSFRQYRRRAAGKTAALFTLSLQCGSQIAELPEPMAEALRRYGYFLGISFQMADDRLDLRTKTGKPQLQDYKEGLINLPLLEVVLNEPALRQKAQPLLIKRKSKALRNLVLKSGGLERAFQRNRSYVDYGLAQLKRIPEGTAKQCLTDLADFSLNRTM